MDGARPPLALDSDRRDRELRLGARAVTRRARTSSSEWSLPRRSRGSALSVLHSRPARTQRPAWMRSVEQTKWRLSTAIAFPGAAENAVHLGYRIGYTRNPSRKPIRHDAKLNQRASCRVPSLPASFTESPSPTRSHHDAYLPSNGSLFPTLAPFYCSVPAACLCFFGHGRVRRQ